MAEMTRSPVAALHGAARLPTVDVDSYNLEIEDADGFVGDRASRRAFRDILEKWRRTAQEGGRDSLGDLSSHEIPKKKLDDVLTSGEPAAAAVVQSAIEDFARELARIVQRFVKVKTWRDTDRIACGGGFRDSRVGEVAIKRAAVLLKAAELNIDLSLSVLTLTKPG
jgi:hypothetical protein